MKKIIIALAIAILTTTFFPKNASASWRKFCSDAGISWQRCKCVRRQVAKKYPRLQCSAYSIAKQKRTLGRCKKKIRAAFYKRACRPQKVSAKTFRRKMSKAQKVADRRLKKPLAAQRRRLKRRYRRRSRRRVRVRSKVSMSLNARGIAQLLRRSDIVKRCNGRLNSAEVRECVLRYEYILQRYEAPDPTQDASRLRFLKQRYRELTSAKGWDELGIIDKKDVCGIRKYAVGKSDGYRRLSEGERDDLHECIRKLYEKRKQKCEQTLSYLISQNRDLLKPQELEVMSCESTVVVKGYADWRSLKNNMTLAGNRRGNLILAVYAALGRSVSIDASSQHEIGEFQYERAAKVFISFRIKNAAYIALLLHSRRQKEVVQKVPSGTSQTIIINKSKKLSDRIKKLEDRVPNSEEWKTKTRDLINDLTKKIKQFKYPFQVTFGVSWQGWGLLNPESMSMELSDRGNVAAMFIEVELKLYFGWRSLCYFGVGGYINPITNSNRFGSGLDLAASGFFGVDMGSERQFDLRIGLMWRGSRVNFRQGRILGANHFIGYLGLGWRFWKGMGVQGRFGYQNALWTSQTHHGVMGTLGLKFYLDPRMWR